MPKGENENWTSNNFARLASAGGYRVFAVAPIDATMVGGLLDAIDLEATFGVPVTMPSEVLKRAFRRFSAARRSLMDGRNTLAFAICTVQKAHHGRLEARVDDVCLMSPDRDLDPELLQQRGQDV